MDQEALLQKVRLYAHTGEQLDHLCEMLHRADYAFQNSQLPKDVTITDPRSIAVILAEWRVPVQLIETAMWSAALYKGSYNDFVPILGDSRARVAVHLVNFMNFLTECRSKHEKCKLHHTLFEEFWRPGFVVILVGMFLDAIRRGASSDTAPDKRELAFQARTIFEPIVKHLDMCGVWRELSDLAFQCEEVKKYTQIQEEVEAQRQTLQLVREQIELVVQTKAKNCGISNLELRHEIARPYKIHILHKQKSHQRKNRLSICDLISFVAILPNVDDCYRFLRPLHMVGASSHPSNDDYAVHPKSNGYRSLHERIDIPPYGPIRFYIRTPEWDEESQFGVLTHWWHRTRPIFEEEHLVPQPPRKEYIFVYTKQGEPYPLPRCATPIDLAYMMNEMIGHRFSKAYIFGKGYVESDHCLEDGDVVQIIPGQHPEPDLAWLESVKTKNARRAIRLWETRQRAESSGKGPLHKRSSRSKKGREITQAVVIPPEHDGSPCYLCDHCKPHPPQPICAYVTHHRTLTIHRPDCSTIHDRMETVSVSWRLNNARPVSAIITIKAWDYQGLLQKIINKISPTSNMVELHAKSRADMTAHFTISLQEQDHAIVEKIGHDIKEINGVYNVNHIVPEATAIRSPFPLGSTATLTNAYTLQPIESQHMFFGRRIEILDILRALQSGGRQNSILFWGQQRVGKTSLLRHIEDRADLSPYYIPVRLSMHAWRSQASSTSHDLVLWFANEIEHCLTRRSSLYPLHLPSLDRLRMQTHPEATLIEYIHQLTQAVAPYRIIVMIDEFQRLSYTLKDQGEFLIKCLARLLESFKGISFIFAGWGLTSWLPARFQSLTQARRVGMLDEHAAENLIRTPVLPFSYEEGVVERILELTNCHPHYIHVLCGSMVDKAMQDPTKHVLTRHDFNEAVEKLLHGNAAPFSQLLETVPAGDIVLDGLARSPSWQDRYVEFNVLMRQPHVKENLPVTRLHHVIEELLDLEIVEKSKQDHDAYRICLPLFHEWAKRNPLFP